MSKPKIATSEFQEVIELAYTIINKFRPASAPLTESVFQTEMEVEYDIYETDPNGDLDDAYDNLVTVVEYAWA